MMRRFTLLLFLVLPVFLFSQVSESTELKNTEGETPILKSDLVGLDVHELIDLGFGNIENITPSHPHGNLGGAREDCFDPYIAVNPATYTPVPRNDDGSLFIPSMGFTFSF